MAGRNLVDNLPHVWVEKPERCIVFKQKKKKFAPSKPMELTSIDSVLWHSFISEIGSKAMNLNKGIKLLFFVFVITFVPTFTFLLLPRFVKDFELKFIEIDRYFSFLAFLAILIMVFVGRAFITSNNQKIDEEIEEICETFNPRFQQQGYSIVYRTIYTGQCKPKYVVPARAIVFIGSRVFDSSVVSEAKKAQVSTSTTSDKDKVDTNAFDDFEV